MICKEVSGKGVPGKALKPQEALAYNTKTIITFTPRKYSCVCFFFLNALLTNLC